jgi:hypothetical protein
MECGLLRAAPSQRRLCSMTFGNPSSSPGGAWREGGGWSATLASALAMSDRSRARAFFRLGHPSRQAKPFGGLCAYRLLAARHTARHQHGALVERKDFAERVVSAHGDDGLAVGDKMLHARFERDAPQLGKLCDPRFEPVAGFGRHEGAGHNQALRQRVAMRFVGRQDPVNERLSVTAAARRDEHALGDVWDGMGKAR